MKPHHWIFIVVFLLSAGTFHYIATDTKTLLKYYSKIQGNLFTGFLTIGGFILSIKTFILIRLKGDIYDHEHYDEELKRLRAINKKIKRYTNLENLGKALVFTIFLTLTTSVSHITIGFLCPPYGAIFCASLTVATLSIVSFCWYLMSENIKLWFGFIQGADDKKEGQDTGSSRK